MTIDEAIELLNAIGCDLDTRVEDEKMDALCLGIEALKKLKANREYGPMAGTGLLPGETEE